MTTVYVSNCGHDENGRYSGGVAGDQTGTEWHIIPWYQFGQNVVLRHPSREFRDKLAELAREAAANDKIGYDQSERTTFYEKLSQSKWQPRLIKTRCEADCSSGVCALAIAAGHLTGNNRVVENISKNGYTGNMINMFSNAGFEIITSSNYLYNSKELIAGDIILNTHMHTNIVVNSEPQKTVFMLEEDGLVGYKTILMMQQALKSRYRDGLISGQFIENKKYLPNLVSVNYNNTGSQTIMDLQKLLSISVDGYAGYETVCALQKHLNRQLNEYLAIDGVLGYHTATRLQIALNRDMFIA